MAKLPEIQFGFEIGVLVIRENLAADCLEFRFTNWSTNEEPISYRGEHEALVQLSEQGWQLRAILSTVSKVYYYFQRTTVKEVNDNAT